MPSVPFSKLWTEADEAAAEAEAELLETLADGMEDDNVEARCEGGQ